jgi:hypothetical protein
VSLYKPRAHRVEKAQIGSFLTPPIYESVWSVSCPMAKPPSRTETGPWMAPESMWTNNEKKNVLVIAGIRTAYPPSCSVLTVLTLRH